MFKVMEAEFLDVMFSTNATLLNEEMSKFLIESGAKSCNFFRCSKK